MSRSAVLSDRLAVRVSGGASVGGAAARVGAADGDNSTIFIVLLVLGGALIFAGASNRKGWS